MAGKSQAVGAEFEEAIETMAKHQGWVAFSLDPPAAWTPSGFRKGKSPFDRVMFKNGRAICFDAKSTADRRYTIPRDKRHIRQVSELMRAGEQVPAGYIIYFRSVGDRVVWYNHQELYRVITGPERSLSPDQGLYLGTLMTFNFQPVMDLR